jgi:hypothetical protein
MAGTYFEYTPGRIATRFSHDAEFDYVNLDISMDGDITTTIDCDEDNRLGKPQDHKRERVNLRVFMSSVFCPFRDFLRFLEAITLEVQHCSFGWDAEGPNGEMHWQRRFIRDTGFLTITWDANENEISHRMMLNTRQTVKELYSAFRTFVESPDYDPLRYEELANGEKFSLVLSDASLEDLARAIAALNVDGAHAAIRRIQDAVSNRSLRGPKLSFPITYFVDVRTVANYSGDPDTSMPADWKDLEVEQRMTRLMEIFEGDGSSWYGDNLRELRSKMVEEWLAQPEPPLRRNFSIQKHDT